MRHKRPPLSSEQGPDVRGAKKTRRVAVAAHQCYNNDPRSTNLHSPTQNTQNSTNGAGRIPQSSDELVHSKKTLERLRSALVECRDYKDASKLLILKGDSGSGKTLAFRILCHELNIHVVEVDIPDVVQSIGQINPTDSNKEEDFNAKYARVPPRAVHLASSKIGRSTTRVCLWFRRLGECASARGMREPFAKGFELIVREKRVFSVLIIGKASMDTRFNENSIAQAIEKRLPASTVCIPWPSITGPQVKKAVSFSLGQQVNDELIQTAMDFNGEDLRSLIRWLNNRLPSDDVAKTPTPDDAPGTLDPRLHPSHTTSKLYKASRMTYETALYNNLITRTTYDKILASHTQCMSVARHVRQILAYTSPQLKILAPINTLRTGEGYAHDGWRNVDFILAMNNKRLNDYFDSLKRDLGLETSDVGDTRRFTQSYLEIESPKFQNEGAAGKIALSLDLDDLDEIVTSSPDQSGEQDIRSNKQDSLEADLQEASLETENDKSLIPHLTAPLFAFDLAHHSDRSEAFKKRVTSDKAAKPPCVGSNAAMPLSPENWLRCVRGCLWEDVKELFRSIPDNLYQTIYALIMTHILDQYINIEDAASMYRQLCLIDKLMQVCWNADAADKLQPMILLGQIVLTEPLNGARNGGCTRPNAFPTTEREEALEVANNWRNYPGFLSRHKYTADMDFGT